MGTSQQYNLNDHAIYRLMRVAEKAFYDFTPKEIQTNVLSSKWTKMPRQNKCYEAIPKSNELTGNSYGYEASIFNEGVLSMYLPIDIDGRKYTDYVDLRNSYSLFDNSGRVDQRVGHFQDGKYSMFITDGKNKNTVSMDVEAGNLTSANYGHGGSSNVYWAKLEFSSMKEMNNGCSLGELFTIDVLNPPKNESSRASIGTAFNINYETEDIINDILETNDIPYTKTNTANKYYDSINLTGLDSYTACSFTASFKNRKMVINGSDIKLVNNTENIDYTNIVLDEDSDNSLIDISRDISLYDFYNTVTVYGDNVKYTCRDYKSVKKVGAIELEETDLSIVSEDGAKTRARKLLDLHSKTSNAISFKTSYDNIPYLKPGQIIQLDYSSENIPKGHYIVLSIDYHLLNWWLKIRKLMLI